jgi:multicomponent K+:H+ antiporter subunit A
MLIALAHQSVRGHRAAASRPPDLPAVDMPAVRAPASTVIGDD